MIRKKSFAFSSFPVCDRSEISKVLLKLCVHSIDWVPIKHGFRFDGEATGMEKFVVFFWSSKKTVSFAGKGALSAKRWIWTELDMDTKIRKGKNSVGKDTYIDNLDESKQKWSDMDKDIDFSKPPLWLQPIPDVVLEDTGDLNGTNSYIGPDARDIDMISNTGSPRKISAKAKRELYECQKVLRWLQNKTEAKEFLEPVDWNLLDLPDYPKVIKNPMDLHTAETKLNKGVYSNAVEFSKDMELIWSNAMVYNRPNSGIWKAAKNLRKLWRCKFSGIKKDIDRLKSNDHISMSLDSPITAKLIISPLPQNIQSTTSEENNESSLPSNEMSESIIWSPGREECKLAD